MSVTWFELPPPAQLGDGWSLRFLTAAQMLECRGEGEAKAQEERDKALWANASLLARVLLKEGEPAFSSGEAILDSLTVGQIDSLTRRWWAQDSVSGGATQEGWPLPEGWTFQEGWPTPAGWSAPDGWPIWEQGLRQEVPPAVQKVDGIKRELLGSERGENERFDMDRYLALGGRVEERVQEVMEGSAPTAGPFSLPPIWPQAGSRTWPEVWPWKGPVQRSPGTAQPLYRQPYTDGETVLLPQREGAGRVEIPVSLPGSPPQVVEVAPSEHSVVQVLLPETVPVEGGLTVEELDRAVERDARRYDGGSSMY